jgi:peptidyl-prolyl cis-trans isomerase A (cyclophilin A)
LTAAKFWNDCRFFRVLPGFVCQFGIAASPAQQSEWRSKPLPDDPVRVSNKRGTVCFATAGPNTRTTQLFISTADNAFLDRQGFSPIGKVVQGMEYVDQFYAGYGEGAPSGRGPNQNLIQLKGNVYLQEFPQLSYISSAAFVE